MIAGVKLKKSKGNRMANVILTGGSGLASLPQKVAHGLDVAFSKQTSESGENLIILLQNKIRFARPAYERSKKCLGNTVNIELDEIILSTVLEVLEETVGVEIYQQGTYLVPFEEAVQIVKKLQELFPHKDKPKNKQKITRPGKNIFFIVLIIGILVIATPFLFRYAELQYYYLKGNDFYSHGKKGKALAAYDKMLEINSNDIDAWIGKGRTYQALDPQHKTLESFDKALEIKPNNVTWYYKGRALYL